MKVNKIQAIIVDDEQNSRATLGKIIAKYCPQVEIIGEADCADMAYELVCEKNPQLVFLDVEMPHATGFDFLDRFEKVNFGVIFTTAYGKYALKAIQYKALDYLMKPINIPDLINAVGKVG